MRQAHQRPSPPRLHQLLRTTVQLFDTEMLEAELGCSKLRTLWRQRSLIKPRLPRSDLVHLLEALRQLSCECMVHWACLRRVILSPHTACTLASYCHRADGQPRLTQHPADSNRTGQRGQGEAEEAKMWYRYVAGHAQALSHITDYYEGRMMLILMLCCCSEDLLLVD